jgi:hypothetical protein
MHVEKSDVPLTMTDTRWSAMTNGKDAAEQVWNRRHQINEALIGIGARPHDEFELFVTINEDDSMTLFDENEDSTRRPIQVPPPPTVPNLSNRYVRRARISVAQDQLWKARKELDRSYVEDASFSAVGCGSDSDYDTFIERIITVEDAHAWRPGG